ncbi:uncharacterized protein LOC135366414 isoform X2 [Ornithodoros turicata]|uniref:uncharacterized protein LOC135366414 isoform X2 n=1 Tax=Ornithodoros turicata TaxID=34597 RepID=UPI003138C4A6
MESSREAVLPFAIVKFLDESVAVVACSWIDEDGCRWPPSKDRKNIGALVRKQKEPEPTWKQLSCKVLERYATYDAARANLSLAEETSDLNAEIQYGRGKRKKRSAIYSDSEESQPPTPPPPSRTTHKTTGQVAKSNTKGKAPPFSSRSSQQESTPHYTSQSLIDDMVEENANILPLPEMQSQPRPSPFSDPQGASFHGLHRAPRRLPSDFHGTRIPERSYLSQRCTNGDEYSFSQSSLQECERQPYEHNSQAPATYGDKRTFSRRPAQQQLIDHFHNDNDLGCTPSRESQRSLSEIAGDSRSRQRSYGNSSDASTASQPKAEFEKKVIRSLNMITLRLQQHSEQLDVITSHLQKPRDLSTDDVLTEPFTDVESLLAFDRGLHASSGKREKLLQYIITLGGNNNGDKARRFLCQLMTDAVALQFSWKGAHGKNRFKSLECASIICRAITMTPNSGTIAETEKAIMTWLRHAGDRMKKRNAQEEDL